MNVFPYSLVVVSHRSSFRPLTVSNRLHERSMEVLETFGNAENSQKRLTVEIFHGVNDLWPETLTKSCKSNKK
jgi:hypothetical protein